MSLSSVLKGAAGGFLGGGPGGAIIGAVTGLLGTGGASMTSARPQLPSPTAGGGGLFGGMNAQADMWLQKQGIAPVAGSCPKGYHLNRHALSASKRHGALPARSICVRNRKLNPLNSKALVHALRREKRARKLLSRLHVFKPVARATSRSGHRAGCGCVVCKRR